MSTTTANHRRILPRRPVRAAFTVALAGALLVGCSAVEFAPVGGPEPTETVVVTPTPEPVEIVAGAEVTAEQARRINDDTKDNAKAYPLADGRWVIVVKDQPVPDAVAADGGAKSRAAAEADAAVNKDYHKGVHALTKQYAAETGKKVIHVRYEYGHSLVTWSYEWLWTVGDIDDPGPCGTAANCVAKAEAWIAQQPDAPLWTVLVSAN